jgi:hypothetical protein
MGWRTGRTEPDLHAGACDADLLRMANLKPVVQHIGGNGHLGALPVVGFRTASASEAAFYLGYVGAGPLDLGSEPQGVDPQASEGDRSVGVGDTFNGY